MNATFCNFTDRPVDVDSCHLKINIPFSWIWLANPLRWHNVRKKEHFWGLHRFFCSIKGRHMLVFNTEVYMRVFKSILTLKYFSDFCFDRKLLRTMIILCHISILKVMPWWLSVLYCLPHTAWKVPPHFGYILQLTGLLSYAVCKCIYMNDGCELFAFPPRQMKPSPLWCFSFCIQVSQLHKTLYNLQLYLLCINYHLL